MAILVDLSVNESSQPTGGQASFVVRIRNNGAAAVNVRDIAVFMSPVGSPAVVEQPVFRPSSTTQVLETSGELSVPFSGSFFAMAQSEFAASKKTEVGIRARVTTREVGSSTDVITATEQVSIQVQPITVPPTAQPVPGQFDWTTNRNSALKALGFCP